MKTLTRAALLSSLVATAAQATPVTYTFTGTINQVGNQLGLASTTIGEQIPISITVDTAAPGAARPDGSIIYTYGGPPFNSTIRVIQVANFGREALQGDVQSVTVQPSLGISFATGGRNSATGFTLSLSDPVAGVLTDAALPTSLNAGDFAAGTFTVTEIGSPTIYGYSGTINSLANGLVAMPEPGTLGIVATGVFALACWRRRGT